MARPRHKHVHRRTGRGLSRRALPVVLPAVAALALGGSAAAMHQDATQGATATSAISRPHASRVHSSRPAPVTTEPVPVSVRMEPISRSAPRVRLQPKPPTVTGHRFTTVRLNVWTRPSEDSRLLDVLDPASRVAVSGETHGAFAEVVVDGKSRWVHAAYLAAHKPQPEPRPQRTAPSGSTQRVAPAAGGVSAAPCPSGSSVESGLVPHAVTVHRAVCAAFPQLTSYGGLRPGDAAPHGTGQALDVMVGDPATGDAVAAYVRSHAGALGVSQVIWSQHIWTVQRSSEGWRAMPDRGSPTANHYDHVHVTVY